MFKFEKSEKGMLLMAVFISEIVRQGVSYTVEKYRDHFVINLTGGY